MANRVEARTAQVDGLSAAEVQCLELVAEGITASKAIAARTGLSPGTIDTYLSRAARTLGADSRRAAAVLYRELANAPPVEVSQSTSQSRPEPLVGMGGGWLSGVAAGARWLFTVPPISGPEHSFTWIEKTLAILRIAAVSLSAVVILTMVGAGLLWVTGS